MVRSALPYMLRLQVNCKTKTARLSGFFVLQFYILYMEKVHHAHGDFLGIIIFMFQEVFQ